MDITHRPTFNQLLSDRFPGARFVRQENKTGWSDSFEIGILTVSLIVYTTPCHGMCAGTLWANIWSKRMSLWSRRGHGDQVIPVLDELRQELLGLAHGLGVVCGRRSHHPQAELLPDGDPVDDLVDNLMADLNPDLPA